MQNQYEIIQALHDKWVNKNASDQEIKQLFDLLANEGVETVLSPLLEASWLKENGQYGFNNMQQKEMLGKILTEYSFDKENTILPRPFHRIHFLNTIWFKYAAAIIIMLGVGSYLWFNNTTPNPVNQKNPFNPSSDNYNHNRAILTLANGQQIILDSTQGNIIKQGNLTVVNLAGKLNYEGAGADVEFHTLSTPKGGQYQIVLPDGTKVWLNAASSITFPTVFAGKDRTVNIIGEAYFEVVKNTVMPFKVNVNKQQTIEVLGTSFNVNAYNDEGSVKTTLIEGSVRVKSEIVNKQSAVILKPGEQSVVTNQQLTVSNNINIDQIIAWKNGFFNLQDQSLEAVARQLERWYDIEVKYEGNLPHKNFEGKLGRGERLSTVLHWFSELGIRNRMEGRILILSAG